MAAVFQFKGIKPKALDIKAMQEALLDAANKAADGMEKDFEETVKTWNNKPTFEKIVDLESDGISVLVGTDDRIYNFINNGTRIRHALMSDDWSSKTQPGKLKARSGSGHVVAVSKNIVRPGIEPRKFDEQIQKKWDKSKRFKRQMEQGMRNARNKSGWAI